MFPPVTPSLFLLEFAISCQNASFPTHTLCSDSLVPLLDPLNNPNGFSFHAQAINRLGISKQRNNEI